jgi:hypothetical protein
MKHWLASSWARPPTGRRCAPQPKRSTSSVSLRDEVGLRPPHSRPPVRIRLHGPEPRHRVIVAGAGGAAHLPGMTASKTTLPVLGVPVQSKALSGLDSLLSIVQMPAGIPVATFAIGVAGATNAGPRSRRDSCQQAPGDRRGAQEVPRRTDGEGAFEARTRRSPDDPREMTIGIVGAGTARAHDGTRGLSTRIRLPVRRPRCADPLAARWDRYSQVSSPTAPC